MTRKEAEELMGKAPEELTSKDVENLKHLAHMLEVFPDYLDMLDREVFPMYVYVTETGGKITRRILVGYE